MTSQPPNNFFARDRSKQENFRNTEQNRNNYFKKEETNGEPLNPQQRQAEDLSRYAPPTVPPASENNQAPSHAQQNIHKPRIAFVAFWLGIASLVFVPFTAIAAIIVGHKSLQVTNRGRGDGYVYAILGTIFGYFSAVVGLISIIIALALPVYINEQKMALEKEVNNDVRTTVSQLQTGTLVPEKTLEKIVTDNGTQVYILVNVEAGSYTVEGLQDFGGTVYYSYIYESATDTYQKGNPTAEEIRTVEELLKAG